MEHHPAAFWKGVAALPLASQLTSLHLLLD